MSTMYIERGRYKCIIVYNVLISKSLNKVIHFMNVYVMICLDDFTNSKNKFDLF